MRLLVAAVAALLLVSGCDSSMPDVSQLSDATFDAINHAGCPQLAVMIANSAGRPGYQQYHDFAQWRHDAVC